VSVVFAVHLFSTVVTDTNPDLAAMSPEDAGPGSAHLDLKALRKVLGIDSAETLKENLRDLVFVSVDCEAFEFDQTKTTEVGISILDTRNIRDV
jgi:hypothetical protein